MERIILCLGERLRESIYYLNKKLSSIKLSGYIISPLITNKDNSGIIIYVNKRLINDHQMYKTIKTAFRTTLKNKRNPICILNIKIHPNKININIHPKKIQIRFIDQKNVNNDIVQIISNLLGTLPWLKPKSKTLTYNKIKKSKFNNNQLNLISPKYKTVGINKFSELKIIGQTGLSFILLEHNHGLIIIDQHAAHERIVFEKISKQIINKNIQLQYLLIPIKIELSITEMLIIQKKSCELNKFGIKIEPFGEKIGIIRAIPNILKKQNAKEFIRDTLKEFLYNDNVNTFQELSDKICMSIACYFSIRFGKNLSKEEIMKLLLQLDLTRFNMQCPHGRPIIKYITFNEISKWFKRH